MHYLTGRLSGGEDAMKYDVADFGTDVVSGMEQGTVENRSCDQGWRLATGAVDDDEWGPERGRRKALVDSFYGTDRGLTATSETRAEIVELITQLGAKNPTPALSEALTLLNGKWILAYTSFSGLFPLLSRGLLQLARVEEISQTIDSLIGEGSYGRVYFGVMRSGQSAAIKKLDSSKQPDLEFLAQHLQYCPDNDFISPITAAWTTEPCDMGVNFIFVLFYL
ncbi:hypothetical protein Patl1_13976 [Pistacia atlantica]|uniref:Uncharacterized protein n=1 Tax=Pistacia atlantica TaxID=434234 RepID=A0ACC1ASB7_9ROSI|nr:hypothetical protein Patl1_13976 [Pistacia atlantica]